MKHLTPKIENGPVQNGSSLSINGFQVIVWASMEKTHHQNV